jgi:5-methylcytosine-specific restriction endonuclease McrA
VSENELTPPTRLPVDQISHISIRNPSYVAGTNEHPEVKVFVQTNTRHVPLSDQKLNVGQTVWMKWVGGPIVAKSKLLSWHSGDFSDGNVNDLRELTIGSGLFGLNDYWKSVSDKRNGFYTVVQLSNEEWVEDLIYPATKAYGSSWVYLDTLHKQENWLTTIEQTNENTNKDRRPALPARLRFMVLRAANYTCKYCGRKAPNVELHVDHIIPWKEVRQHKIDNLAASCKDCNFGKGILSA